LLATLPSQLPAQAVASVAQAVRLPRGAPLTVEQVPNDPDSAQA
jgi:hypothetical protein